jgi:hypothetical protein
MDFARANSASRALVHALTATTASVRKKKRGWRKALPMLFLRRIVAPLIPAEALHALDGAPHDGVSILQFVRIEAVS